MNGPEQENNESKRVVVTRMEGERTWQNFKSWVQGVQRALLGDAHDPDAMTDEEWQEAFREYMENAKKGQQES